MGAPRRISEVGRRLLYGASLDEKDIAYGEKPGFSWGVSIRSVPKDWH